jgi:uncharacterized membrane protein
MPVIKRSISLKVPAEEVFRYLGNPSHLTEFCPNMMDIGDVRQHPQENTRFTWVYKMMGIRILGEAEFSEVKHDQQLNVRFWGGIQGNIVWRLQPADEGILLEVELDYTAPTPLLKKHSADAMLRQNEHAVEDMLTRLQALMEALHPQALNKG